MEEQIGNVRWYMEILSKKTNKKKEMIKITTEMNIFDRLISKPDMIEGKLLSLRFSQKKPPKLKIT